MPFPTQFPQAAMEHLVQELLGAATEPLAQLVEDAYDVLGYGLFLALDSGRASLPMLAHAEVPESDEEKAQLFKDALHPQATAIPWGVILPIILELLKKWLGR